MPLSSEAGSSQLVLVASRLLLTRRGRAARLAESALGRRLATVALSRLGSSEPVSGDRGERPTWPCRTRGSISHNQAGLCVAVVSGSNGPELVGVDVEETSRLEHVATEMFTDSIEREQLRCLARETGDDPVRWKARMFTAKEATWKALTSAQSTEHVAVTLNQGGGFTGQSGGQHVEGVTVDLDGETLALASGGDHVEPATSRRWQRVLALWRYVVPYPFVDEITLPYDGLPQATGDHHSHCSPDS
ncbi:MAG: 4'-phosphopantetheinyl transferase superfamily protein [Cutibacterium avidum]|uniref:4'-phosphopantetheinyl transferase superfamily protein n=1 Tax=Actinomyces sp. TaxID=29317 RepID=UPI00290A90EA|nr:4'-phosphopantetheinyl transferase superfamily protein [Cutibacterium avidum]